MARKHAWRETLSRCFRGRRQAEPERPYVVKGQATEPLAQALEVWLDARRRLEVAVLSRKPATAVDLAQLDDLRGAENAAWQHFRTLRLFARTKGGP